MQRLDNENLKQERDDPVGRIREPVLGRTTGVTSFELDQHPGRQPGGEHPQLNQRGITHKVRDAREHVFAQRFFRRRHRCREVPGAAHLSMVNLPAHTDPRGATITGTPKTDAAAPAGLSCIRSEKSY
ncbi:hypothetical protein CLE01_05580 [Cryobacterium levicorallinum]|nr:hypothetical protein CLE01_05580 [Cryobacterium levicorallinum]